ncbi:MAG: glycosyltransferase family 9 protein [Alphaproteobacteria bacterium]|nr:glycosyltransferase family 9 protein [Alphaproteobacteria bacterium]
MNVLFITSSRIGDAVLSTGLLDYIAQTWPHAKVTIVCGPLCVSLFEGYPYLARIIPLKKQSFHRHWLRLWTQTAGTPWDMVVDLRNSAVSRLVVARKKYIFGPHIDHTLHKTEQNAQVMRLSAVPSPRLWFSLAQKEKARHLIKPLPSQKILALAPTANWRAKTWSVENFIQLAEMLTCPGGLMENMRVAVFAAPGEEKDAYKMLHALPTAQQIDVIAKTDPGTAAAALALCDFFIGNDSGLMHCAAAARIPTLGLFGPSWPHLYRPWGKNAQFVQTPKTFAQLIDYPGYDPKTAPCLMTELLIPTVCAKVREMLVV